MSTVFFKLLHPAAKIPQRATKGSAGRDAIALEPFELAPGESKLIPLGYAAELPQDREIQVRPRSGLANKFKVTVLNSPGTVDSDYRGEIKVMLINHGAQTFHAKAGDAIAQLVIAVVPDDEIVEKTEISATERGAGGFGSTTPKQV